MSEGETPMPQEVSADRFPVIPHDGTESTAAYNTIFRPFAINNEALFTRVLVEGGKIDANDPELAAKVNRVMGRYVNSFIHSREDVEKATLKPADILSSSEGGAMDAPVTQNSG